MLVFSAVLALISVLVGSWLALGSGEVERETRQALGVEDNQWERRMADFTAYADDFHEYRYLSEEQRQLQAAIRRGGAKAGDELYGHINSLHNDGYDRVLAAVTSHAPAQHAQLQRRAGLLLEAHEDWAFYEHSGRATFDWRNARHVESLELIVERQLVPSVDYYSSPLAVGGTVSMVGIFAGGVFIVLMMFAAPLLGGVQVAQEVHENTLQPVTGTSLSPRQLIVGLASGPLAQAGLLAIPQLLLILIAASTAGRLLPAIGLVGTACAAGVLLLAVSMLTGLLIGRRRSPGLVGIGLCSLLGVSVIAGLAMTEAFSGDSIGMVLLIPHAGPAHLLREAFAPATNHLTLTEAVGLDLRLAFSIVAFAVLAGLAALAAERRLLGKVRPSLTRVEALVGAVTLIACAALAVPNELGSEWPFVLAGMAMLVAPFELLLMARVPAGDAPPSMRKPALGSLLGEAAVGWGLFLATFVILIGGAGTLGTPAPAGLFCIVWALGVTALVGIRGASIPARIPAMVWLGFCLLSAFFNFVLGVVIIEDSHATGAGDVPVLVLGTLSWLLGAAQLVLTVVIPVVLVRSIRR